MWVLGTEARTSWEQPVFTSKPFLQLYLNILKGVLEWCVRYINTNEQISQRVCYRGRGIVHIFFSSVSSQHGLQSTRAEVFHQSNVSHFMLGAPRMTLSLYHQPIFYQVSRTLLGTRLTIQTVPRESSSKPSAFVGFLCQRGPVSTFPSHLYLFVCVFVCFYYWDRVSLCM